MSKGNSAIYRPLSEIIDEALMDSGDGIHFKERYTRWAIKYAEEVFQDGWAPNIISKRVDLLPWNAIEVPVDCHSVLVVGIQNGSDIMAFVYDRSIAQVFDKDSDGLKQSNPRPHYCDIGDIQLSGTTVPFWNFSNNLTDLGENPGKLFGLMVKDNGLGYFTENKNKDVNEIQLKIGLNRTVNKIYLMYQTTGFSPTGETMIHPDYAEYIVQGIHRERQSKSRDKSGLAWTEEEFKRQYFRILDKKWDYGTEDIMEYLKSGYGPYPKK